MPADVSKYAQGRAVSFDFPEGDGAVGLVGIVCGCNRVDGNLRYTIAVPGRGLVITGNPVYEWPGDIPADGSPK